MGFQKGLLASPIALKVTAGVVILASWELIVRGFAPSFVATPSGIMMALPKVLADPLFLSAAAATLQAVAAGLLIAVALGIAIGLSMGRIRTVDDSLRFYVNGLFNLPMIAVLPLLALWLGHNGEARLAQIVLVAFLSVALNVADGARSVSTEYMEVARAFRAPRLRTLFEVVLLASVPYVLAGLRLAAGRALTGAVIADFYLAIPGLGYYILYNSRSFHHNEALVAVLVLVAGGVGFDRLVSWGSRRLLPWLRRD
jgi:ABC-type nitrate/sulfonate/bicarbonate transport system permease component